MRPYLALVIVVAICPPVSARQGSDPKRPASPNGDEGALTFPTSRELSRSIVRDTPSKVDVGFPETGRGSSTSADEAFRRLNSSLASRKRTGRTGSEGEEEDPGVASSVAWVGVGIAVAVASGMVVAFGLRRLLAGRGAAPAARL